MKKTIIYLAAAAMFTACSSDIDYTEPDNMTDEIAFTVGNISTPNKLASRAEHTHNPWNAAVHANTLGVFGFCEGGTEIFKNQQLTYNESKWEYTPKKYWQEYINKTSFDFFGYMVEEDELPSATIETPETSKYTLSFPASISSPILTSADKTPLICHAPVHTSFQKLAIPFDMDQTLTGYCIQFQLDEKMDALRYFVIKSIKVSGTNLPKAGTVKRTYTFTNDAWTAGTVVWTSVTTSNVTEADAVSIPISSEKKQVTVNTHTDWVKWGDKDIVTDGAFYAIPSADFNPTIEVTYDVYSDASTMTRKDVKSKIILNTTNFSNLVAATTGEINPIKIKIVPDYLYVLSDDDHATGVLVVGNK